MSVSVIDNTGLSQTQIISAVNMPSVYLNQDNEYSTITAMEIR